MDEMRIYFTAWFFGLICYWQTGQFRELFWNPFRRRIDWPNPDVFPLVVLFLLSPLPGLIAVGNFILAVRERMARSNGSWI